MTAEESSSEQPTTDAPKEQPTTDEPKELTPEEEEKLGNLVANEEWSGLSMELTEVIATAVVEDLKRNSRDFLGKEDYAIGDFSKELDKRVKDEVAKMREKDDYEVSIFIFFNLWRLVSMYNIVIYMCIFTHNIDLYLINVVACCCCIIHTLYLLLHTYVLL